MVNRLASFLVIAASTFAAAIPTPTEHLGYAPGTDYKLADYGEITSYFQKLAAASDRIKVEQFGTSSYGKPMYVAYISSAENLKKLARYKEINRRLALGKATPEEARQLSKEGKAIIWIDSGLHSSEAACAQGAPELAYQMVNGESEEIKKIRDNVILIQVPVLNPDGHDLIVHWFRKNQGTEFEASSLPELYQKYAGHDNNRDWYMFNLQETRHIGKLLFQDWFPHIIYNQHQAPAFPARIFTPPYAEPMNPNIPAPVMEGINLIGSAMRERLAREDKGGVLSYYGFDGWWDGGLRSTPAFHNMHGILTEVAMQAYAIPREYKVSDLPERFPNGIPTKTSTIFYTPWLGGKWGTRDAIEYMLTVDYAILNLAANMPDHWLYKAWDLAHKNIETGSKAAPFAYVIPPEQWDRWTANEMVKRLLLGGLEVQRATAEIRMGDKVYPAGSYVLLAGQAFRGYLVDLMDPQVYPELKAGTTGPTKRPYDVAGWTLPMQMGVEVERVTDRFDTSRLETVAAAPAVAASADHRDNSSFLTTAQMLAEGKAVRWTGDGKIVTNGDPAFGSAAYALKKPRVALYYPYVANMDLGWTQWMLDEFHVPYTLIRNEEIQKGNLRAHYDAILFAQQNPESILHGLRGGSEGGGGSADRRGARPRPENTGGIGAQGLAALDTFVKDGGTMITFASASELPLQFLPLPVRASASRGGDAGFYSPGSLLRATVDTKHPVAFGMPAEAIVFSSGGQTFDVSGAGGTAIVRYAKQNLLASGWVSGEKAVLGKTVVAEATYGQGRVLLFGIRPQHRGQPFGTFKLVLNALYLASAQKLH